MSRLQKTTIQNCIVVNGLFTMFNKPFFYYRIQFLKEEFPSCQSSKRQQPKKKIDSTFYETFTPVVCHCNQITMAVQDLFNPQDSLQIFA